MHYTTLELSGKYHEIGPQVTGLAGAALQKHFRFDLFYGQVERIVNNRSIGRVLIQRREGFSVPAFGGLEEIRAALERLGQAGKQVYYYAPEYDSFDCVLSSACSHRIIHPLGTVSFPGIALSNLFFKKLLDMHAIGVEVIRRGRYKSAADRFRTEKHDEYARGQYQALLDGAVAAMREALTRSPASSKRGAFPEQILDEMLAGRILSAQQAQESGIVDELRTINELTNRWKTEKIKLKSPRRFRDRFAFGPRVAVLVFEGMIVDGDNRQNPLFGQAIGDRQMVKTIRSLRENRRVKAVVFRINSGGGSAVASENILRELVALHEKKPLVISMGPVAGSGGYWIASTGRRLFALPTTITGSIGVVTLFFNLAELLLKCGITTDCIKHGESADVGSAFRPLTEKESATIDGVVERLYREFLQRVAQVRKMAPEKVHALGEGRVWLGREALGHGLVDALGGLHDAIAHAKALIKSDKARLLFGPRVKRSFISRLVAARRAVAPTQAGTAAPSAAWPALPFPEADGTQGLYPLQAAGIGGPLLAAVVCACLSLHGQPFFMDPALLPIDARTGFDPHR
jgi:protease IV